MSRIPREVGGFGAPRATPFRATAGLGAVLQTWQQERKLWRNVTLDHRVPAQPAAFAELPQTLPPALAAALRGRGVERLYTHQAAAFEAARAGRDLVIATPTASGKSLCYNLPVLSSLAEEPEARAVYLFPTKALSRDQESALRALMRQAEIAQGAITYDGDTPGDARRAARDGGI